MVVGLFSLKHLPISKTKKIYKLESIEWYILKPYSAKHNMIIPNELTIANMRAFSLCGLYYWSLCDRFSDLFVELIRSFPNQIFFFYLTKALLAHRFPLFSAQCMKHLNKLFFSLQTRNWLWYVKVWHLLRLMNNNKIKKGTKIHTQAQLERVNLVHIIWYTLALRCVSG